MIGNAQTVTIDHSVQRYIGNVSELNRPTYFTIHDSGSDPDAQIFFNDYNTYPGRQFWGPFSVARNQTGSVGTYPPLQGGNGLVKDIFTGIQTEHPYNVFVDGIDTKAAADWAADYYINRVTTVPEFFEPMNEPFVHAGEYGSNIPDIKRQMSELFRDIGNKFHNTPELANMKVIGYSAAWASLELWDFGHWEQNQKMFMDIAGADMDAFATHLYDGVNVVGQSTRRSGSNSDAILDLIETYSYTKWGVVKPHALSEYGAIEEGYGDNYSDLASIQSVRSQNHLIFGFMEREDRMIITIPFNTGKARWHITEANNYQPYGAATWKPSNIGQPNPTGWVYTPRIEFYELWKEVKGKRVEIQTDNPDIQVQAFVDGTKLFVALNNLDDHPQNVDLNMVAGLSGLQNVRIKTLKIYPDTPYETSDNTQTTAPVNISLIAGETAVLEYTFTDNVSFSNVIRSRNYYTSKHLQPITANTPISFTFNGVDTGTGYAKLKMTIGRKHDVSKTPVVTVNEITVPVPSNIKGYDQANRTDFFGTIDIPVPMELIQASNTVTFTFPDNGGRLASVILNTEKYDNAQPVRVAYPGVVPLAIPAVIEAENYDTGGKGIAYHDTDAVNTGGQYRPQDGVDISTSAAAPYFVTSAVAGEWMEYTIDVPGDGEFQLQTTVSSGDATGSIRFEFDGVDKSGTVAIPATGVDMWTTINQSVTLTGGQQVLRVVIESGNLSIDQFNITSLVPVSGIAINTDTLVTRVEKTAQLEAAVIPSYAAIRTFTWNSANTAIAQVDANGLVTGIAVGETTIYAISDDGGHKDSVQVIVQPKLIESATFTEPVPTFIYSGDDVTFKVDYVADSARDIAIELYNPERTQWLGLTRATVQEGTGTVELTISRNEPLPPDTGYRLAASIRPVGTDWRQIIASQAILFDVVERETIDFVALPSQMVTGESLSFDISYTANSERDIFVELYTPNRTQWLGAKTMTVPAGKDTVTLTINLTGAPLPATDYDLGCALRPVGGDWTTTIVGKKALIELIEAGPQNLVKNAGFEAGDFSGWWPQDKEIVTTDVFEGSYSARITGGNVSQPIDVEPSATYEISIANKLVSGSQAGLVFQTIPGYKWLKTVNLNSAQWTETRSSITIPDTLSRINMFISSPAGNVVLVDNITLIKKIPVTGISVTPASLALQVGDSSALVATITPEGASNKKVIWSSDNTTVATVDENGVVIAVGLGKATITATTEDGGLQAICDVTVGTVVNLAKNSGFETGDFTAWTNRNSQVVTDDVFEGAYSALVNSTGAISQVMNVEPSATYILSGASKIVTGTRGDLAVQTWPAKQWLKTIKINTTEWTGKSSLFTVPSGVDQVNVYVYMPSGNDALADNITLVKRVPATGIAITPSEIALEVSEGWQLTAAFTPEDANNQEVNWVSSDTTVATVSENGLVTAITLGYATITATAADGGFTATCEVAVTHPNLINNWGFETGDISGYTNWNPITVQSEDVYAGEYAALVAGPAAVGQKILTLEPNTKYEYSAYGKVTATGMQSFFGVKDYGGDELGVAVNTTEFKKSTITFTTDNNGNAEIYLFSPNGSNAIGDNLRLVEFYYPDAVDFVNIPAAIQTAPEFTFDVQYSATHERELALRLFSPSWQWLGEAIVTVPKGEGTVSPTIMLSDIPVPGESYNLLADLLAPGSSDLLARKHIEVNLLPVPVETVTVFPDYRYLHRGDTATFNATVLPADATNKDIIWTSSDPSIATVDTDGLVTALERGTAMIMATSASDTNATDTSMVEVWYQSRFSSLTVPGIIELENYDEGGEGVAYHDATPGNSGNAYRNEGVDIVLTNDQSGAYHVTDIEAGEWLEYEIDVLADGDYYLYLRATAATESVLQLEIETLGLVEQLNIPATGMDNWSMIPWPNAVSLTADSHIMKLTALSGEFQLNFMEVEAVSPACQAASDWDAAAIYNQAGAEVLFEGKRYASKYYTQGNIPGASDAWELLGYCGAATLDCYNTAVWNAQTTYPTVGFQVIHNGTIYTSQWYATAGQEPGVTDVWKLEGPCTASSLSTPPSGCPDVAPWVGFATYSTAGTEVTHQGMLYVNQWYATAGDEPGAADVWNPIRPCTPVYEAPACPAVANWNVASVYSTTGTEVLHNGAVFTNRYYASAGQEPGVAQVWEYQYSCGSGSASARQGTTSPDLTHGPEAQLKMYPNPLNRGALTIEILTNVEYAITIFNAQGALVYELNATPTEYQSEVTLQNDLEKGVYFVTLQTEHGQLIRKLVVN